MFLHLSVILFMGESLSKGGLCQEGFCPRGGSLFRGVSVQGGLCPGGSLSRGFSAQRGSLSGRPPPPSMVMCRKCASYWNAFLFNKVILQIVKSSVSIPMIDIKLRVLNR